MHVENIKFPLTKRLHLRVLNFSNLKNKPNKKNEPLNTTGITITYCFYVVPSPYNHDVTSSPTLSSQPFKFDTFDTLSILLHHRRHRLWQCHWALWPLDDFSSLCAPQMITFMLFYNFTVSSVPHDPSKTSRCLSLQEPAQRQWWENEGTQTVLMVVSWSPVNSVTTVH